MPDEKTKSKWIEQTCAVVGLIFGGVTLGWTWAYFIPHPIVEYELLQALPVLNAEVTPDLELTYRGQGVRNPYIVEVRIGNTGNRPLKSDDYTDTFEQGAPGLSLKMDNTEARILQADVIDIRPPNRRKFGLQTLKGLSKSLVLPSVALNAGDSYTVKLIVDGSPGRVLIEGHLVDFVLKEHDQDLFPVKLPKSWEPHVAPIAGGLIGFVLSLALLMIIRTFDRIRSTISIVWSWFKIRKWLKDSKTSGTDVPSVLTSNEKFKALCQKLKMKGSDQRELLRSQLADHVDSLDKRTPDQNDSADEKFNVSVIESSSTDFSAVTPSPPTPEAQAPEVK